MMEPYADASCILRVDIHCDACKSKMVDVMSSVSGPYSIDIDGEENVLKMCGEVEPNRLLAALSRGGKHTEIVKANLKHPALRLTNSTSAYRHSGSARDHGAAYSMYGAGYGPGPGYAAVHQSYQAFPVRGGGRAALPHPPPHYLYDYTPRYVR
ncbi:unnamed protein product [Cuscuta campestris]|uniref:HMA domain-containing protein n=1 Tax=Cuscuta campestris TaxID=132261 RepID=A0A484NGB7_9ASTE|nr:unnamed protein product [Cuscuta campestris]